jgi:cell division septal protein FtsQ
MKNFKRYCLLFFIIFLTTFNPKILILNLDFFKVKTINVSVGSNVDLLKIKKELNFLIGNNIFEINHEKINEVISSNNWINYILVNKKYPSTLNITVVEHEPIFFWKKNNKDILITKEFTLIDKFKTIILNNLNQAKGNFQIEDFADLYNSLKKNDFDVTSIISYEFLNSERWELILKNKQKIMLGRYNYDQQIKNLNKILKEIKDEKFSYIDLRIRSKIFVK